MKYIRNNDIALFNKLIDFTIKKHEKNIFVFYLNKAILCLENEKLFIKMIKEQVFYLFLQKSLATRIHYKIEWSKVFLTEKHRKIISHYFSTKFSILFKFLENFDF